MNWIATATAGAFDVFLQGLKVLDVGSYIAGPGAATVMSDFGADVIKVEPLDGDPFRNLLGLVTTEYPNFFWDQDGRNKRSLALDITTEEGTAVMHDLIAQSDVFITNYRPDLLSKLRLAYEDVAKIKPKIVYGQINAFGLEGPEANRTGFDASAWWAQSGMMDYVRNGDSPPGVSSPGMGDHPTCIALFGGIMGALYRRERTGEGAHVHTSLLASGAWSHSLMIQGALVGFDSTEQRTADDAKAIPLATTYATSDGRVVLLCILNADKEWPKFLRAIERPDLAADPRFADRLERMQHGPELYDILVDVFASRTAAEWADRLNAEEVTYSLAHTLSEVINNEQLYANDILTEMTPGRQLYAHTVNSPIWITGENKRTPVVAPHIGEHTVEILNELGRSPEQIKGMLANGTARQEPPE